MANNYKVSGKKLTSRFGMSHSQTKATTKWMDGGEPRQPGDRKYPLSKRLAKKCKHKRWIDEGYGGPESGGEGGHCRDCGYGFFIRLY
jgi:hypothetical protein